MVSKMKTPTSYLVILKPRALHVQIGPVRSANTKITMGEKSGGKGRRRFSIMTQPPSKQSSEE